MYVQYIMMQLLNNQWLMLLISVFFSLVRLKICPERVSTVITFSTLWLLHFTFKGLDLHLQHD